ncbi:transposase (fragment) [Mesorhizobium prunaredense]|uniref:Transposase n=1 Tax=Mesorhizobium prunaredense TaxID=1631249 RepID=A0A1R3VG09_9HYPH
METDERDITLAEIAERLAAERDITLAEIAERLAAERGIKAGVTTIHEFFAKRGITYKKDGARGEQQRPDVLAARDDWFDDNSISTRAA